MKVKQPPYRTPKKPRVVRKRAHKQERRYTQRLIDLGLAGILPAFIAFILVYGTPLRSDWDVLAAPDCNTGSSASKTLTEQDCVMQLAGIDKSSYEPARYIFNHESGSCYTKFEGQIGFCPTEYQELRDPSTPNKGFGLCQATPAIKMSTAGEDWKTNPVTQAKWCNSYAISRYGSWQAAYTFWTTHKWW